LLNQFDIRQRIGNSWRYYMIGFFYGKMLPGIVGGDVVRLGLSIQEHRGAKTFLAASIFFERSCGLLVILMIAAVAVLLSPSLLQGEPALLNSISILALVFILIFFAFFVAVKFIPDRFLTVNIDRVKKYSTLINLLRHFKRMSFKVIILILSLSFLAHAMDISGSYYLAKALYINQPLSFFFIVMPVVYVVTLLPISLGGLGIREGVLAFFLIKVGVLSSDAVLLGFLIYLNRILLALIGGVIHVLESFTVHDAK
jgi:glycosyltransferase 2 family protein